MDASACRSFRRTHDVCIDNYNDISLITQRIIGCGIGHTGLVTTIGFLHTSPVHVATFDRLVAELTADRAPAVVHVVDERLLDVARADGPTASAVMMGIGAALDDLAAAGVATASAMRNLLEPDSAGLPMVITRCGTWVREFQSTAPACLPLPIPGRMSSLPVGPPVAR